ncbi:hypothetical protein SAMN05443270_1250 [Lacrimispora sphenoides]|jgi:hypothetical protein|uniref:hypothetical protein n=1 Tax=Lacrimispora sphenoides TaxID=29370 RepID=UPI0008B842DF|nr:hypothetical protein [Lacrimispora sphenoides]SET75181.1 hypothetical protein SAMN05443270_1250 [Lacrimispora sphenoides]
MNLLLKSGTLYQTDNKAAGPALANIHNRLFGLEKQIIAGEKQFLTQIQTKTLTGERILGAGSRQYLLKNSGGEILLSGVPKYADENDPAIVGKFIYRMQRVNSVELMFQDRSGLLQMINSQNYRLSDPSGKVILTLLRRGIFSGGWNLDAAEEFQPEFLCGIFIFCRYMEQENELPIV